MTSAAGSATSAQVFTYEACKVPKLGGKKLKASKKRIRGALCKVGKVKKKNGATAASGKVVKQQPAAGTIVPPGSQVKVTLAP